MITEHGPATATDGVPASLRIHTMARRLWGPMLGMGAMFVLAGFFVSLVWSTNAGTDPLAATRATAWTQGLQFLGEGFPLSGISFLLGSILGLIRDGGAEAQRSLGLSAKLLDMPNTATSKPSASTNSPTKTTARHPTDRTKKGGHHHVASLSYPGQRTRGTGRRRLLHSPMFAV